MGDIMTLQNQSNAHTYGCSLDKQTINQSIDLSSKSLSNNYRIDFAVGYFD